MLTWLRCVVSEEHAPVAGYSQPALWVWITPFSFGCKRNQRKIALLLGWNKALSPAPACSQSDTKLLSGMKSHACGISHTTTRTYAAVRKRLWLWAELCACGSPGEDKPDPDKARAHDCLLRNQSRRQAFRTGFTRFKPAAEGQKIPND